MEIKFYNHLKLQIKERGIAESIIKEVLLSPEQLIDSVRGYKIAQSKYFDKKENKYFLIRVVFKEEKNTRLGITAYKTSKIDKYWR